MVNKHEWTKERQALLLLLKKNRETPDWEELDHEAFIQESKHHRVYPVIYQALRERSSNDLPSVILNTLDFHHKSNLFSMMQLTAEMAEVSSYFLTRSLPLLFLKGPVLAKELYGDLGLRTSCDLDFLVPIERLHEGERLLLELGYVKNDYIETVLEDWKWRHHHVTYYHPTKKIKIEMHWRLHPGPGDEPDFHTLWERKDQSTITTIPVYQLSHEDLFYFLVTHGFRHGWSRLRWLYDVDRLLQKDFDWMKVQKHLEKYGVRQLGIAAILLCHTLFETELPAAFKATRKASLLAAGTNFYFASQINLHSGQLTEKESIFHKKYLFKLMGTKQKIIFLLSFLYPYPEDAKQFPLPQKLHYLYFPLRPLLWGSRKWRTRTGGG